jgi:hypothetical protein
MSDMVSMANPLWVSLANNQTPRSTQQSVAPALAQPTPEAKGDVTPNDRLKASVTTLGEMDTLIKLTNVIFQELPCFTTATTSYLWQAVYSVYKKPMPALS